MIKRNDVFSVEVDAAGKAEIEKMLRRLKVIDLEAIKINKEAKEGLAMHRGARRIAQKSIWSASKLRNRLEALKKEREEIAEAIRKISKG